MNPRLYLHTCLSRFKSLIDGLKAEGNLPRQIEALNELCELLCMATEESLQGRNLQEFASLAHLCLVAALLLC